MIITRAMPAQHFSGVSHQRRKSQHVDHDFAGAVATTLGGIIKHLRLIELYWFQRILAQTSDVELPLISWRDLDSTFYIDPEDTGEGLIEHTPDTPTSYGNKSTEPSADDRPRVRIFAHCSMTIKALSTPAQALVAEMAINLQRRRLMWVDVGWRRVIRFVTNLYWQDSHLST